LAQLVAITAYYFLLKYGETRGTGALAAMVVLVPIGLMVKQNLAIWAVWFAGFLLLCGSWKQLWLFLSAVAVLVSATLAACYLIWGTPFFYWNFYVLLHHHISPLRTFQHILTAWPYFAAGLLGGAAILQRRYSKVLLGAWLVWMAVIGSGAYTSGVAWMLNHIGPGCLIAGVWFLAGLASVWDRTVETVGKAGLQEWIRCAAVTGSVALFFSGLGVVRIPVRQVPVDAYRYVGQIEHEFEGQPANRVLLDAGSWVYMKDRVIMGDRAAGIGERGYSRTADFSGILSRISSKHYSKILLRGFHDADFVYDYYLWSESSGIRRALLENYRETGKIPAAQGTPYAPNWAQDPYYFGDITILEPKTGAQGL
jgi:hypothetical protein